MNNQNTNLKFIKASFLALMYIIILMSCNGKTVQKSSVNKDQMIVRISEVEINATNLEEYISILKEEAEASVRLETGVISIFPMYQKDKPTELRILEIYKDKQAYQSHLKTPHFKHYKSSTLKMVKSLKLIDMNVLDFETMQQIFAKMNVKNN